MARRSKINWEEHEQDKLFTAVVEIIRKDARTSLIKAMQLAQLALQEGRRRNITSVENIPGYLRDRFITNNLLAKDWQKQKRGQRAKPPAGPDPRDERIKALEEELGKAKTELRDTYNRISELERRPGAMETIQDFLAETYALAMQKTRALPGPNLTPVPPPRQPAPRHNPEMRQATEGPKPEILLVGVGAERRAHYEKKFSGKFSHIRYWSDGNVSTLSELAKRSHMTFIMADQVNDYEVSAIQTATEHFQRVQGAESRIEEELENWLRRRAQ